MTGLSVYVTQKTPFILPIPFVMLLIDGIALYCRVPGQIKLFNEWIDQDNICKTLVAEMSQQRALINAYRAGHTTEKTFVKENADQNLKRFVAGKYQQVTEKILKWNHTVFITLTFCLGAIRTMNGDMKLPDYVIVMATILNFDREITVLFNQLSVAVNGFVSVQRIAGILNAPTRKKANLAARSKRLAVMHELNNSDPDWSLDPDCLMLCDVEYDYAVNAAREAAGKPDENGVYQYDEPDLKLDVGDRDPTSRMGPLTMVIEQGTVLHICLSLNLSSV